MSVRSTECITKEGSILCIYLNEKATPVKVDCRDFSITSFTGRSVKYVPQLVMESEDSHRLAGVRCLIEILNDIARATHRNIGWRDNYINKFRELEPFLTVIDLINDRYSIPTECPKGYIKFVKENNLYINCNTLDRFKREQKLNTLEKHDKDTLKFISDYYENRNAYRLDRITRLELSKLKVFLQIFRTSIKKFSWDFEDDLCNFLNEIENIYWANIDWTTIADTNRSFQQNCIILNAAKEKHREEKIIKTVDRIRPIAELESEHYCVIVPTCLEDFSAEGNMQNNCAGYYYHSDMENGRCALYFIRKKDTPNQSNTTCRYVFHRHATDEYRIVNNGDVTDREVINLIKTIDEFLKQNVLDENN